MDLAQMAGWLAAAAAIIAMLKKSDLRLKQGLIIHTVLYGVHFALLGLPTAVVSCVIALARITLSIYTRSLLCAAALIIISAAMALALSRSTVDILPLAASVVLTLSLFRFDGIKLRLGLLAGSILWLIHNVYFQSWGGICLETCFCLSTLWGLWTMVGEQNEKPKKEMCLEYSTKETKKKPLLRLIRIHSFRLTSRRGIKTRTDRASSLLFLSKCL